jgi:aminoglycoside N3'-acetyltransferase
VNYKDDKLVSALLDCGIRKGDIILVHCSISFLKGIGFLDILSMFYNSLKNAVGSLGTICAPAYYYEYSREGKLFNPDLTLSSKELGIFPRYLWIHHNYKRSLSPLASIIAVGYMAEEICGGNTTSNYGVDSAFDRLYKHNAKMLFIGVDCRYMTFVHYVEWHVGVPQLYTKLFTTPIYKDEEPIDLPVCQQVRFRNSNVKPDGITNTEKFERAGIVKYGLYEDKKIRCVTCGDAFYFLKCELQKNPFYLLKEPMKFTEEGEPMV